MERNDSEFDVYYIPPNFIEGGTVLGGLFKLRNVIEAGILALGVGVPIFMIDLDISAKVVILCFTALPLALIALIGISGESLFSYIMGFLRFVKRRRVLGANKQKQIKRRRKNIER
ncbi:MAG: cell division protein FtsW [Clostridia bacterium]|nr:cell division protein FtsW [Clostridia bacterium]MBQ8849652.1 cell division protein FtsW [Clostridia bacterium]